MAKTYLYLIYIFISPFR